MKRLLLVLLVACKSSNDTKPPPTQPPGPPIGNQDAAINSTRVPEPAEPDLCDAYDRSGVVAIFGWKGMQKVSTNGLKQGEKRERHCAYRAVDDAFKDATFGIAFSTELPFLQHHPGFDITYAKRAAIGGLPAWSGTNKDLVSVQVQDERRRVRIITTLAKSGTPEEMLDKLGRATEKLVASMPADPIPLMHK